MKGFCFLRCGEVVFLRLFWLDVYSRVGDKALVLYFFHIESDRFCK